MNTLLSSRVSTRFLALILVLSPITASATHHFVRPYVTGGYGPSDGSTYNTAWNGLSAIEWPNVTAGDTVYLCGTHKTFYGTNLAVAASGTAGSPIVISGSCPGNSGTDNGALFAVHAEISPASWSGPDANGLYTTSYVGCTPPFLLEREGTFPLSPSHPGTRQRWARDDFANPFANLENWTPGSFDQDGCGGTIYYKPATPGASPGTVYTGCVGPVQITNRSYVTIRDLALYSSIVQSAINLHNADHIVIENNDIQWGSDNIVIEDDSDNGIIRNNRIHDTTGTGIYFLSGSDNTITTSNDRWLVQNNEIYNVSPQCQWCGVTSGGTGDRHAIGVQGGGNNNIFEFNHIHHSGGDGIVIYNQSGAPGGNAQRDNIIRYNYIHDVKDLHPLCLSGGPVICQPQGGIWLGSDATPADPDTITGNIVHHNVLVRINGIALRTKSTKPASGYTWKFLNNTIIDSGIGLELCLFNAAISPFRLGGAEFRNNIIYDSVPGSGNLHLRGNLQTLAMDVSGYGMSNNIYYPNGPERFKWDKRTSSKSDYAGWTALSGIVEAGSLTSNPQFIEDATSGDFAWAGTPIVIPESGNFQLTTASPALDSGAIIDLSPGQDADIVGNPVAGTRDRGAYEFLYADLSLSIEASPNPVVLGESVTYTIAVDNLGPITAMGVAVTGTLLTCNIGTLLSGTSGSCSIGVTADSLTLPTQTMTAEGAEIDLYSANNSASVTTTVQAPDLREETLQASVAGPSLLIDDRVQNSGNGNAGAFEIRYLLSTNATYESTDTLLCNRTVTGLAAGASNPASGTTRSTCPIPSTAAGPYNIIALVDTEGTVAESNEGNNVVATQVQVIINLVPPPDADSDGMADVADNCVSVANANQCDSDSDGYGNRCDGDLNNNGATNAQDTTLFRQQLGQPSVGPTYHKADLNCNGAVNAQDTTLFRQLLGAPPGPSGL